MYCIAIRPYEVLKSLIIVNYKTWTNGENYLYKKAGSDSPLTFATEKEAILYLNSNFNVTFIDPDFLTSENRFAPYLKDRHE